eukprot:11165749-Lingulodinium_polyedra.AAC.1
MSGSSWPPQLCQLPSGPRTSPAPESADCRASLARVHLKRARSCCLPQSCTAANGHSATITP